MTRVVSFSTGLLAVAVALLVISYALAGFWQWAFVFILVGLLWWIAERQRGWHWAPSVGMVVLTAVAASGYWLGMPILAMLAVVILALSAWDLDAFADRLAQSQLDDSAHHLVQSHLRRLIIVNAVALVLAAFSLTVEFRFSFIIAFILGLLMAYGLNRLLVSLGKNNQ
jgi:hypothetical protein